LETNNEHINNLFKQKFEDFAPQPPERVWANIASALDKGAVPVWYHTLTAKIVAVLLGVIVLWGGYRLSKNEPQPVKKQTPVMAYQNSSHGNASIDSKNNGSIGATTTIDNSLKKSQTKPEKNKNNHSIDKPSVAPAMSASSSAHHLKNPPVSTIREKTLKNNDSQIAFNKQEKYSTLEITNNLTGRATGIEEMQSNTIALNNSVTPLRLMPVTNDINSHDLTTKKQPGRWVLGLYFSPEFIFDPFDSLTIQNSYALKVEPTYYMNNHWFIRPGIGVSYARDKGFVKADYLSWDYLGSYEDVIDVTFDTVDNTVTPVYHTQTRDVYDSIMHVTVSEETNRYLYLQTSLVFGYHNHINKFGWSIYAGPQVNFILAEKRDNPLKKNTSTVYLKYNLAQRRSPQYGLKLGVGIDYAIAKNWLVTVEPEYNYFFNGINGSDIYSKPLSGIGSRFGLIYTIK